MKLICNADDFGHSRGVNLGIVEAYQNGLVRSTTMMAGMPGFDHAAALAAENPDLGIGVHLTLSAGKSVGGVYDTLTDRQGAFLPLAEVEARAKAGALDLSEVEREYRAQIEKIAGAKIPFDHFDSHHHTHNLPGVVDVFLKLAAEYGVAVRLYDRALLTGAYAHLKTTAVFVDTFYGELATALHLRQIVEAHRQAESVEVMCHPAYLDHTLSQTSSYALPRTAELHVLTDGELGAYIREQGVTLSAFSQL